MRNSKHISNHRDHQWHIKRSKIYLGGFFSTTYFATQKIDRIGSKGACGACPTEELVMAKYRKI
jgi:hypothetical protein